MITHLEHKIISANRKPDIWGWPPISSFWSWALIPLWKVSILFLFLNVFSLKKCLLFSSLFIQIMHFCSIYWINCRDTYKINGWTFGFLWQSDDTPKTDHPLPVPKIIRLRMDTQSKNKCINSRLHYSKSNARD